MNQTTNERHAGAPAAPAGEGRPDWRNLSAAIAAITVFGFALGLMFPLLSLLLERRGYADDVIGLNAAMSPVGILLFSPMIPFVSRRFGHKRAALGAAGITALLILSYKIFWSLEAWFVLRLLQGMAVSTLFVLSEAWVVKFSEGPNRGKIVALYASVLSVSFGCGPLIISIIGVEGWAPFVTGAVVLILAMIPIALVRDTIDDDAEPEPAHSFRTFAPKAPVLLFAILSFAVFDAATLSLLPVYGVRVGLELPVASMALTALVVGNAVLQMPIGWLADRFRKRLVMLWLALVCAGLLLLLPLVMGTFLMWPLLPVIGAAGAGIYTVGLAELGERFQGEELVAGTAAFSTVWGLGALVGSAIGGIAMYVFGPHGLPVVLAAFFSVFIVMMIGRERQRLRAL
ncbi:MAG: MFS transporter [Hyphomicrobiales bacterium]